MWAWRTKVNQNPEAVVTMREPCNALADLEKDDVDETPPSFARGIDTVLYPAVAVSTPSAGSRSTWCEGFDARPGYFNCS